VIERKLSVVTGREIERIYVDKGYGGGGEQRRDQ
jgi:hypothetical protein